MQKPITPFLTSLLNKAKDKYDNHFLFLSKLARSKSNYNKERLEIHNQVFDEIDCLDCGNCCKTTPAIVLSSDIKKIAKFLDLSKKQFSRKYLMDDLTGDTIFNNVPCTFLGSDNKCSIYEVRPQACRNYPHTDESAFNKRARWNTENTLICPAAYAIVEKMEKQCQLQGI